MNNVESTLQELKKELDKLPLVNEFLNLKEVMEKDEELVNMRQEIARLKSEGKEEERQALLEIYNSHPIVTNYEQMRSEVASLLNQIKEILSD